MSGLPIRIAKVGNIVWYFDKTGAGPFVAFVTKQNENPLVVQLAVVRPGASTFEHCHLQVPHASLEGQDKDAGVWDWGYDSLISFHPPQEITVVASSDSSHSDGVSVTEETQVQEVPQAEPLIASSTALGELVKFGMTELQIDALRPHFGSVEALKAYVADGKPISGEIPGVSLQDDSDIAKALLEYDIAKQAV